MQEIKYEGYIWDCTKVNGDVYVTQIFKKRESVIKALKRIYNRLPDSKKKYLIIEIQSSLGTSIEISKYDLEQIERVEP